MRPVVVSMLCAGCDFSGRAVVNPDATADGALADAASDEPDAAIDTIDFLPPVEETAGTMDWTIGDAAMIDTTTLEITPPAPLGVTLLMGRQDSGGTIAILRVKDLTIGNRLYAYGDKPLAILAERVTIGGTLDVGAHLAQRGPGGSLGAVGLGAGGPSIHDDGTGSTFDDSGAGGGSFGTAGGSGGTTGPFAGGAGGPTYPAGSLVGGSGGGAAGACSNLPGAGGGALLLYARQQIRIAGAITAGGGGGAGGLIVCPTGAGAGAGGGAGGLIWIQTPDLGGAGTLAANGGGGGGGCYINVANGGPGEDGKPSVTDDAQGGAKASSTEASVGGSGAILGSGPGAIPSIASGNAGGGGGGLGRIVYRAPSLGGLQSSPQAVAP